MTPRLAPRAQEKGQEEGIDLAQLLRGRGKQGVCSLCRQGMGPVAPERSWCRGEKPGFPHR